MNIYLEIFGYVGTVLVILSMMMTSLIRLRIINICGSIISTVYSVICNAWPIAVMNFCLILINTFQSIRQLRKMGRFVQLRLSHDDPTLQYFLSLYAADIEKSFPDFHLYAQKESEIHMIYVGNRAVGLLVGTPWEEHYRIEMDYVLPAYRDAVLGKFLFRQLRERGIRALSAPVGERRHARSLLRLGFEEADGVLYKQL